MRTYLGQISFDARNFFDCACARPLLWIWTEEPPMLSAVVGTSFILSIGMLMAHAVDAFRNRLP